MRLVKLEDRLAAGPATVLPATVITPVDLSLSTDVVAPPGGLQVRRFCGSSLIVDESVQQLVPLLVDYVDLPLPLALLIAVYATVIPEVKLADLSSMREKEKNIIEEEIPLENILEKEKRMSAHASSFLNHSLFSVQLQQRLFENLESSIKSEIGFKMKNDKESSRPTIRYPRM